MSKPLPPSAGHETRDVRVSGVVWFAVGLAVMLAAIALSLVGLYHVFKQTHPSPDAASRLALHPQMIAPAPRLQTNDAADLEKFRAAEEAQLHSYGWIDRSAGIIHLPIARAMELIAERGLPTRGPGAQDASGITSVQMQERKAAER